MSFRSMNDIADLETARDVLDGVRDYERACEDIGQGISTKDAVWRLDLELAIGMCDGLGWTWDRIQGVEKRHGRFSTFRVQMQGMFAPA